ncbi:MAG: NERD domain-containing protein [Verrucomicrobia bacterium]|nr:NERD domain-containing protein [Verrucomicrobiota bacterium]MCH8511226.1 NERD domain-containing protein [Kiritimatiellia bacterium]
MNVRIFIGLGLVFLLGLFLKSPVFKGWVGELFVKILLKSQLDKGRYEVLHNVTLPAVEGTTQIDHIVLSRYGIFVIETKNMKGWIFGSERQSQWTQKIYKHRNRFQNPLRQNYKHTETLRSLLELPKESLKSIVVFVGDSTFKTEMPPNVTFCRGCTDYIRSFHEEILTDDTLAFVKASIVEGRLEPGLATNRRHVRYLREHHAPKESQPREDRRPDEDEPETHSLSSEVRESSVQEPSEETDSKSGEPPSCPKCGDRMILRTAKKGANQGNQFWGCRQYPRCRGLMPLDLQKK